MFNIGIMRKYIHIALLSVLVALTSCDLNEKSADSIPYSEAFKSIETIESLERGAYSRLRTQYSLSSIIAPDIQADYIAGYGNGKLYLALSNQSDRDIEVKVTFDPDGSFIDPGKEYRCKVWIQNRESGSAAVSGGEITLPLKAKGITAVAIDGVDVKTRFQDKLQKGGGKWEKNFTSTGFENDRAVLFDFGQGLKSVYVWNEADNSVFSRVSLHYSIDGGPEMTLEKSGYPYEFTVEIPDGSREFRYRLEGIAPDGAMTESGTGILRK